MSSTTEQGPEAHPRHFALAATRRPGLRAGLSLGADAADPRRPSAKVRDIFLTVQGIPGITASPEGTSKYDHRPSCATSGHWSSARCGRPARAGAGGAGRDRHRALHQRVRPPAAGAGDRLRHRPAGRRTLRGFRGLGDLCLAASLPPGLPLGGGVPGLDHALRPAGLPWSSILTAGLMLAIMVVPIMTAICREIFAADPAAERGGRAGPGRHPLGDGPGGRPPLRRLRQVSAGDARAGPGDGGDHGGRAGACRRPASSTLNLISLDEHPRRSRRTSPTASRRPAASPVNGR